MFSVREKRAIAHVVQAAIRATQHPELPIAEIQFELHVQGGSDMSFAYIRNNGAVENPSVNPWNEQQDRPNQDTRGTKLSDLLD
jgi:hypothetical protein